MYTPINDLKEFFPKVQGRCSNGFISEERYQKDSVWLLVRHFIYLLTAVNSGLG